MTRHAIAAILLAILIIVPASGQNTPQPCAVQVVIDLQTYDGPKHYQNFCLSQPVMYGDGLLSIVAISLGDGLFRDGFDTPPVATSAEQ